VTYPGVIKAPVGSPLARRTHTEYGPKKEEPCMFFHPMVLYMMMVLVVGAIFLFFVVQIGVICNGSGHG
jgi:hypothetical protein